jgi:hypothetical protein
MNAAATTIAINEVLLAIMAPLQRAIRGKVHAAAPAGFAVLSVSARDSYGR